jgi:hypothetical protein
MKVFSSFSPSGQIFDRSSHGSSAVIDNRATAVRQRKMCDSIAVSPRLSKIGLPVVAHSPIQLKMGTRRGLDSKASVIQRLIGNNPTDEYGEDFLHAAITSSEAYRDMIRQGEYTKINAESKEQVLVGNSGNVAFAKLVIAGLEPITFGPFISGNPVSSDGTPLYNKDDMPKGKDVSKNPMCSEPKILSLLREHLRTNGISGDTDMTLMLYSENTCCPSCFSIVNVLKQDFSRLEVRVYATRHQGDTVPHNPTTQVSAWYKYFEPATDDEGWTTKSSCRAQKRK